MIPTCQKNDRIKDLAVVKDFSVDYFIERDEVESVLLKYSIVDSEFYQKNKLLLEGYGEEVRKLIPPNVLSENDIEIAAYEENNTFELIIQMRSNENGYFIIHDKKPAAFVILNADDKIVSYYIDVFSSKGKKVKLPAYLLEIGTD